MPLLKDQNFFKNIRSNYSPRINAKYPWYISTIELESFWHGKPISKILLISCTEIMSIRRFRSFQIGIIGLCGLKDCITTSCQSWRSEKNPAGRPELNHTRAAQVWVLDDLIILKVWKSTKLAVFWPTETHSTSFERSKPLLLTHSQSKKLGEF